MKQPELTPNSEKIDKIITRISSGDIKIPAFQRPFVWSQNQIIQLLESVLNNYPIGSILLWNTHDKLQFTRNIAGYEIPENDPEYPVNYVLDGQQRLSSIYGVFCGDAIQIEDDTRYNPNKDIFELYYALDDEKILPKNEIESFDRKIELRKIIDAKSFIQALSKIPPEDQDQLQEVFSKFNNYEIPVVTIKNRMKDEVGVIFERINNTGTRLSTLDLMIAWTWTDDFHFMNEINDFIEELDEKNFGSISRNLLLQIISGLIQNDTQTKSILNLSGVHVRDNWSSVKEAIKKAIDFLSTDLNCKSIDFLPYHQQLAGLSKFFQIITKPSDIQLDYLKKWFWHHSFTIKYFTGQTTEKMNIDIKTVEEIKNGDYSYFETLTVNMSKSEIVETKFSKANYLTRSVLLLLAQQGPIDLCNGNKIDLGQSLSSYNRKEYHHIFPKAYLKQEQYDNEAINSIANFCFLPADSNKIISDKKPSEYFDNVIPKGKYKEILRANLIPSDNSVIQQNDFGSFLDQRADLFIQKIRELIN